MHSSGNRPRELRWYHAGPMLFGDWGTSRLYVLGLAFAFNGRASFWYVAGMCVLLVGVGRCYEVICRLFPDGGGVYSSAKHRSQLLAVVGALLLCADYVVTASLSCLDAFHYLGVQRFHLELPGFRIGLDAALAAATILAFAGVSVAAVFALAVALGGRWAGSALMAGVALGVGFASHQTQRYRTLLSAPGDPARMKLVYEGSYRPKARIMVSTQGNPRLLEFALRECKDRQAELNLLFVRHIAVTPMGPVEHGRLEDDRPALALFEHARDLAVKLGVPLRLLYAASRDIPDAILDMAVTHAADLLLLGPTRRGALWKAMKGDVIQAVAEHLPERVGLLIHA